MNPALFTKITICHTDRETEAANKYREQTKNTKYQNWSQEVIPFVLETTGRMGPLAKQFFETITANCGRLRGLFMQEIQVVNAFFNGLIFTHMIDEFKNSNRGVRLTTQRQRRF